MRKLRHAFPPLWRKDFCCKVAEVWVEPCCLFKTATAKTWNMRQIAECESTRFKLILMRETWCELRYFQSAGSVWNGLYWLRCNPKAHEYGQIANHGKRVGFFTLQMSCFNNFYLALHLGERDTKRGRDMRRMESSTRNRQEQSYERYWQRLQKVNENSCRWDQFICVLAIKMTSPLSPRDETMKDGRSLLQSISRNMALAELRAAISYSLYSPCYFSPSDSQTLLKPWILTPASLEHGRLAGEGQAKFTDKGQFGGGRTRRALKQKKREKSLKRKNEIFHLASTWWNILRHQ